MIVTIIGLGLIGGSMAISLKESGFAQTIIGVDQNPENVNKAFRRRLIDEEHPLPNAVERSDLIILAIPVNAIVDCLPQVLDLVDQQVIVDVGSTKVPIMDVVKGHPKRAQFLGTHPMAASGPEYSVPAMG
ncbi:MAG: prephenate dehydrogenase/arogenate dehydrogenase family protein, partial [Bacteroidota bacterium]